MELETVWTGRDGWLLQGHPTRGHLITPSDVPITAAPLPDYAYLMRKQPRQPQPPKRRRVAGEWAISVLAPVLSSSGAWLSIADVAAVTGLSYHRAQYHLKRLHRHQRIERKTEVLGMQTHVFYRLQA